MHEVRALRLDERLQLGASRRLGPRGVVGRLVPVPGICPRPERLVEWFMTPLANLPQCHGLRSGGPPEPWKPRAPLARAALLFPIRPWSRFSACDLSFD